MKQLQHFDFFSNSLLNEIDDMIDSCDNLSIYDLIAYTELKSYLITWKHNGEARVRRKLENVNKCLFR